MAQIQSGTTNIHGGTFINIEQGETDVLRVLDPYTAPDAFFNARHHDDSEPARCHPGTRERILDDLTSHLQSTTANAFVWTHGPAGVGKSAVMRSLCERFDTERQLLGSFFFFKGDPTRNSGRPFVPTLAYLLCREIEELRAPVLAAIRSDPAVLRLSLEAQAEKLLIKPIRGLTGQFPNRTPQAIVIDGLDECAPDHDREQVIRVLKLLCQSYPSPLLIFVSSRPHFDIRTHFESPPLQEKTTQQGIYQDSRADEDIRKYLTDKFDEILRTHRFRKYLPLIDGRWPSLATIDSLVVKASGQFIFAATIIRFIQAPNKDPNHRLDILLRNLTDNDDDPFEQLNRLYRAVFATIQPHLLRETLDVLTICLSIILYDTRGSAPHWPDVRVSTTRPTPDELDALQLGRYDERPLILATPQDTYVLGGTMISPRMDELMYETLPPTPDELLAPELGKSDNPSTWLPRKSRTLNVLAGDFIKYTVPVRLEPLGILLSNRTSYCQELLAGLESLVEIVPSTRDGRDYHSLQPFHKSLTDFLESESRAGPNLFIAQERARECLSIACVRHDFWHEDIDVRAIMDSVPFFHVEARSLGGNAESRYTRFLEFMNAAKANHDYGPVVARLRQTNDSVIVWQWLYRVDVFMFQLERLGSRALNILSSQLQSFTASMACFISVYRAHPELTALLGLSITENSMSRRHRRSLTSQLLAALTSSPTLLQLDREQGFHLTYPTDNIVDSVSDIPRLVPCFRRLALGDLPEEKYWNAVIDYFAKKAVEKGQVSAAVSKVVLSRTSFQHGAGVDSSSEELSSSKLGTWEADPRNLQRFLEMFPNHLDDEQRVVVQHMIDTASWTPPPALAVLMPTPMPTLTLRWQGGVIQWVVSVVTTLVDWMRNGPV